MTLFDQQPFGPLPARRPILMPPDPELEAATADPASADIELVGRPPRELRDAVPLPRVRRSLARVLLAVLLLFLIGGDPVTALVMLGISLVPDGTGMYLPRAISAGIVVALLILAHLLFRQRPGLGTRPRDPGA